MQPTAEPKPPALRPEPPPVDVYISNESGVISRVAAGSGDVTVIARNVNFSNAFTVDSVGNVFANDVFPPTGPGDGVYKYPAGGGARTMVAELGVGSMGADYMAADWIGNVYAVAWDTGSTWVVKIPPDGTPPVVIWRVPESPLAAWGIAVDRLQNVYIRRWPDPAFVLKVPAGGGLPTTVADLSAFDFWASGFAVDPQGQNVYITTPDRPRNDPNVGWLLTRVPLNGDPHTSVGIDTFGGGVAADAAGNVYVTRYNDNRVDMFTDSGSGRQITICEVDTPWAVAVPPTSAHRWTVPDLIGKLFGGVAVDGDGWIVIGNQFIPIPPRSPVMAILVQAAMRYLRQGIENPQLGEQLRNLKQPPRPTSRQ